jgi:hypothetical protein
VATDAAELATTAVAELLEAARDDGEETSKAASGSLVQGAVPGATQGAASGGYTGSGGAGGTGALCAVAQRAAAGGWD